MGVLGYDPQILQASWCWIRPDTPHMAAWNFMTGKAWELLAYCLTLAFYTAVRLSLLRHKVGVGVCVCGGGGGGVDVCECVSVRVCVYV